MDTLVLDLGYRPINIVNWKRAFNLYNSDKAELLSEDADARLRSETFEIGLPRVIRLKHHVSKHIRTKVPFTRRNILVRDDYRCQYCGRMLVTKDGKLREFTIDHVLPRSRGGKNTWDNLVACCMKCNNTKDNKTPKEAGLTLLKEPKMPSSTDPRFFRGIRSMRNEWKPYLKQDKNTSWAYWNVALEET